MIEYWDALDCLLQHARPPETESIPLMESAGRVLAEPVVAPWSLPRFDNSSMDGFAVVAGDLAAASDGAPVSLPIVGESAAGHGFARALQSGETVRISTGAEVPEGASAIVPLEIVRTEKDCAIFPTPSHAGRFIRRRGSDVSEGQPLFERGTIISPGVLSMLAFYNIDQVNVFRQPRIGILTSGDEILPHGIAPTGSQIIGSSIYYLQAELERCACEPRLFGIAHDDVDDFAGKLKEMLDWADLIVTTAGVSVGEHDIVGQALARFETETHFWRVAIRPGKPFLFATVEGKPFFGFPGNPVSTCCNTEILLKPFLRRSLAVEPAVVPRQKARLMAPCPRDQRRLFFVYTLLEVTEGELRAGPIANQNSGNLLLPALGNALAIVTPGDEPVPAGEFIDVIPIRVGL